MREALNDHILRTKTNLSWERLGNEYVFNEKMSNVLKFLYIGITSQPSLNRDIDQHFCPIAMYLFFIKIHFHIFQSYGRPCQRRRSYVGVDSAAFLPWRGGWSAW